MTKHYILSLDPNAKYEWDRRTLRDPITAHHPALVDLIAEAVGEEPGSYLIAVNIEVQVLEKASTERVTPATAVPVDVPSRTQLSHIKELVA